MSEGEQIQQPDQELGHGRGGDGARGREDQDRGTQTPAQLRDPQHHGGDTPGTGVFTNSELFIRRIIIGSFRIIAKLAFKHVVST